MKKKDIEENVVEKRSFIDNSTLKEINEKYPKVAKNGVAYDLGLTYITIQTDYFNDPAIRKLVKTYGAEIIGVICFFRMKMCQPFGWYCRVDEDSLDTLIEDCAYTLKMDEDKVKECYTALVDKKAFFVISDDGGEYLADTQQLYNFEMLQTKRLRERNRKANQRASDKNGRDGQGEQADTPEDKEEIEAPFDVPQVPAEEIAIPQAPPDMSKCDDDIFNW